MSLIKEKITAISKSQRFFVAALFFIVGILIVSIFPTAAKFEFKFEKEGIWHKEAITAPFQFSIYKLPEEYKRDCDTLLKRMFQPYFTISDSEREKAITKLNQKTKAGDASDIYNKFIRSQLFNIYQKGIMSVDDYDRFCDSFKTIRIKGDDANAFVEIKLNSVFTPKSAYEYILKKASAGIDKDILQKKLAELYDIAEEEVKNSQQD